VLVQLLEDYPQDVRLVFRHYPLTSIHDKAFTAAVAAEAAGKQGKFFEMKSVLFLNQSEWSGKTLDEFNVWLVNTAAVKVELDTAQFTQDMSDIVIQKKVQDALDSGQSIGIPGTPFILINGQPYDGPRDAANLAVIVELYKLQKSQFTECPPMTIDTTAAYFATIKTTKGDFVWQLYPDKAPVTVNSFIFLANNGWFDNVPFHRVLPGFVAQAGDPSGTGYGGPGYAFGNEISDLRFDKAGVVGMANAGPDSNGSQFFITLAPTPSLDGQYTVFAQVVSGLDVVEKLTARDPSQGEPLPEPDRILSITIEQK
jgi:cyclophilin family peptidyl-prolyl cis-trans isomerase